MIPIHATATANPQQLRWVVAEGRLPARGMVRQAPGRLGNMLDGSLIDEIEVRTADVLITLRAGNGWRELGDDVRDALYSPGSEAHRAGGQGHAAAGNGLLSLWK